MSLQPKAGHGQFSVTAVSFLTTLLLGLGWVCFPAMVEAQARGRMFQIGQTDTRSDRVRQQRDDLDRQQRDQEQRQRQLSEKNEDLLRQQTQVQRTIPLVEQELKRPLPPEEYTAKKCELQELTAKQEQVEQQLKANQGELARIHQDLARTEQDLAKLQQQVTSARERPAPRQPARRVGREPQEPPGWDPAWQQALQAWQQQAQSQAEEERVPDRLIQIMNSRATPLTGIPSDLLLARGLSCPGRSPFATLTVHGPVTFVSTGWDLCFEVPINAQLSAAQANSATKIIVSFTTCCNTLDQGFQFGLKGSPPVTRYFSGSPTFPAGAASNGAHVLQLTPGQFTTSVTDFVLGFSNTPSAGGQLTVSQMRVEFFR